GGGGQPAVGRAGDDGDRRRGVRGGGGAGGGRRGVSHGGAAADRGGGGGAVRRRAGGAGVGGVFLALGRLATRRRRVAAGRVCDASLTGVPLVRPRRLGRRHPGAVPPLAGALRV